jgi:dGTPase
MLTSGKLREFAVIANAEGIERAVCDYISGMTDKFAIRQYSEIFIPAAWKVY